MLIWGGGEDINFWVLICGSAALFLGTRIRCSPLFFPSRGSRISCSIVSVPFVVSLFFYLAAASPQLFSCFDVQLEAASLLMNHHAVVAPSRFQ